MAEPVSLSTIQFLAWVANRPRSFADVREAWRSTCPRLSTWEDALNDHLVRFGASKVPERAPTTVP